MNNFCLLIFVYLIEKVYLEFEKIELIYQDGYFYIPLNFPYRENKTKTYYIFSTKLPMSFYPSLNCSKCTKKLLNQSEFMDNEKNKSIPYYYYNYVGGEYHGNLTTDKYYSEENFVAFDNLTYAKNYSGKGRFSLSYLNYNFNTSKKLFAIKFSENNAELHLGDYDQNRNMDDFKAFNITTEYNYSYYNETIPVTDGDIDKANNIFENNLLMEEEDNKTKYENRTLELDNSMWYITFPKLNINNIETDISDYKLTLDMSNDKFYIPRNFFIKYVDKIFPKEAKCQIARGGYFICQCDEDYKTKFGNFKFISGNGTVFFVNVTDYMSFQSSISGSKCEVNLVINYDNDLFIGGITVLNNYYSIFNIENKTFSILPRENLNTKETGKYLIMFFIVLIVAFALLFGGYFFYNKYVINDPTGLVPQSMNNNANENQNIHDFQG
jgi:hypothetical protein